MATAQMHPPLYVSLSRCWSDIQSEHVLRLPEQMDFGSPFLIVPETSSGRRLQVDTTELSDPYLFAAYLSACHSLCQSRPLIR